MLLHPLPLYNNSVGALDMLSDGREGAELLRSESLRAMILGGHAFDERYRGRGSDSELRVHCPFGIVPDSRQRIRRRRFPGRFIC